MKNFTFLSFFLLVSFLSFGQSSYSVSNKDKAKYLEAQHKMEEYDFNGAIVLYKELISSNPDDYELYVDIGYCYLNTSERYEAISYLEKAVNYYRDENKMKKTKSQEATFLLAEAYYLNYMFDEAEKTLTELKNYSNKNQKKIIDDKLLKCAYAKEQVNNPRGFTVMESSILNSTYPDYCPTITLDQSKIYFTSRREGSLGNEKEYDNYFFEDIYSSDYVNGTFSKPINLGIPVNTEGHEATSSVSPDGKELYIYRSTFKDPGDIYISKYEGNAWSMPVRLDDPINTKKNETHASLSPDGKTMYFTSDRNSGEGGLDIYTVQLSDDGTWKDLKNLGTTINTEFDEEGPFVSPDGSTLYFSSKGHKNIGGYDIFKSTMQEDGTWSTPENMGFPLNTVDDDIFYVPTNDPSVAFYSSKQYSGVSSIYVVQVYEFDENSIYVKGYVYDSKEDILAITQTKNDSVKVGNEWYPKDKTYTYTKNDTMIISQELNSNLSKKTCKIPQNSEINSYIVDGDTIDGSYSPVQHKGKYNFQISTISEHLIHYSAEGFIYDIYRIEPVAGIYEYDAELDTMIYGQIKSIKNTEFDVESNELSDYQKIEFDILASFLNENNDLYVDISTFGSNEAPESWDNERTDVIKNFLLEKGVKPEQIYTGLSENTIQGQVAEYTIYDSLTIKKVTEDKIITKITKGNLITDISFDLNKYENPAFYDELDAIAKYLTENPTAQIGVYGYTDTQGNPEYNKKLSEKRANFVKSYLIQKGAKDEQIVCEGKGYTKQISENKDKDGNFIWQSLGYNRRVEIVVLKQGENSTLYVKPVEVPEEYALDDDSNYKYAVLVTTSDKPIEKSTFTFEIFELLGVDGVYNYIHGDFQSKASAETFVEQIKNKYPKAYVFINNFRK